jgi:hypothetical protein
MFMTSQRSQFEPMTDFHYISYEVYGARDHPFFVIFLFYMMDTSNMADMRISEVGATLSTQP